jgi:hypothetical protein
MQDEISFASIDFQWEEGRLCDFLHGDTAVDTKVRPIPSSNCVAHFVLA